MSGISKEKFRMMNEVEEFAFKETGILPIEIRPPKWAITLNLHLHEPQEAPHVMTVAQYNERFGIKGK